MLVRKRVGTKADSDRFRPTRVLSTTDLLPLERVQIDHTQVDVIVGDEGDRLPIGRPWLTLAIDAASRVLLGCSRFPIGPADSQSAFSEEYHHPARRLALSQISQPQTTLMNWRIDAGLGAF